MKHSILYGAVALACLLAGPAQLGAQHMMPYGGSYRPAYPAGYQPMYRPVAPAYGVVPYGAVLAPVPQYAVPAGQTVVAAPGAQLVSQPTGQVIFAAPYVQPAAATVGTGVTATGFAANVAKAKSSGCDKCGCDNGSCDGGCDAGKCKKCSKKPCCCPHFRFFVFAEPLSLQARDAEVAYGVQINGPIVGAPPPPGIQTGPVGVVNQSAQFAYRVGTGFFLDDCASVTISFAQFASSESDQLIRTNPNDVIRSLVSHPRTTNAATDFDQAFARHDIDFDLVDGEYRHIWTSCDHYNVSWMAGIRYAKLEQGFNSNFIINGFETVQTNIEFNGFGPKFGLEFERFMVHGLSIYGKSAASLVVGGFTAEYAQNTNNAFRVNTAWEVDRIVPIFDLELGVAWTSRCERFRFGAGYLVSAWTNVVKTDDWIKAVQANNFVNQAAVELGDTITFDGFVGHAEIRF